MFIALSDSLGTTQQLDGKAIPYRSSSFLILWCVLILAYFSRKRLLTLQVTSATYGGFNRTFFALHAHYDLTSKNFSFRIPVASERAILRSC